MLGEQDAKPRGECVLGDLAPSPKLYIRARTIPPAAPAIFFLEFKAIFSKNRLGYGVLVYRPCYAGNFKIHSKGTD